MTSTDWQSAPRNWPASLTLGLTAAAALTIVPWYGLTHGYSHAAWAWFVVVLSLNELSITCGYHRLFAHVTYKARPALRAIYLLIGAMTLQGSALRWCAMHRVHHRYIDDPERDPYCARRGFWFSHIGWMLHDYPSGHADLDCARDLKQDPMVMWQHRHYVPVAVAMNVAVPLLLGALSGDVVGTFLLAGVLRLVLSHHLTFFINSLAHIVGTQPYSTENTARDNAVVALLTFGEGYHNYHHAFAHDYRNAVRWWQWDPSKWLIWTLARVGLARDLKRVPDFRIQRALLDAQFQHAQQRLAHRPAWELEPLRRRIAEEYAAFHAAIGTWSKLREQWIEEKKRAVANRWERSLLQSRLKELEYSLRLQYRRMRLLQAQLG